MHVALQGSIPSIGSPGELCAQNHCANKQEHKMPSEVNCIVYSCHPFKPIPRGWFPSASWHSSIQFSCSVVSDSLWLHDLQHAKPPCPSPTPGVHPNPCPLSQWCHPTISSSVVPFSSCPQPFPASGSFPMSQLFTSGGQSIGVLASTSVLPMNIQNWFPLEWTGWIFLKGLGLVLRQF